MTTSNYEFFEEQFRDHALLSDGPRLSVLKKFDFDVKVCGKTVHDKFDEITVASELPYYDSVDKRKNVSF